jgi:hypothetical protein
VDYTCSVATNQNGSNPAGEEPGNAIDDNVNTKFLDFNKGSLVIDFGMSTTFDTYTWATANDAIERDPVSWMLSGSDDGINWMALSTITDYPTTTVRKVYLPDFPKLL